MSQHFLLTRAAKTLSLAQVFRMTDGEAETTFKNLRWADTNGAPVCPICGSLDAYEVQGLQEGLHRYQRDAVRLAQDAPEKLPRGYRRVLQRSEGQERLGSESRP